MTARADTSSLSAVVQMQRKQPRPAAAFRTLLQMAKTARVPSRRALAALAKLYDVRLERRWPFVHRMGDASPPLNFYDLLEIQYARTRDFSALVIGAFDGVSNDPTYDFLRRSGCRAVLVEPQPQIFARLAKNSINNRIVKLINAAVDEASGRRELFCVNAEREALPAWIDQVASFRREHLVRHGIPDTAIEPVEVRTISFSDLLDECGLTKLDLLQIDTEGMDGKLLSSFPFDRVKPSIIYYEVVHMPESERRQVAARLRSFGYVLLPGDSKEDEMAIRL